MAEHLLKLTLDGDTFSSELICVGKCVPVTQCTACGRSVVGDDEAEPCHDCPTKEDPCWLRTWADNEDLTDYVEDLHELGTWPIEVGWEDAPSIRLLDRPSLSLSQIDLVTFALNASYRADSKNPDLVAVREWLDERRAELTREDEG